ncbi:MAG: DUF86 domain-containing protein [Candidatus Kapaibacterium sp.]
MSDRSDPIILDEIIDSVGRIFEYCSGMEFKEFVEDRKTIDAVARNFEIIGEASRQLSIEFRNRHSAIPWRKIIGLRNVIINEYFDIDVENVWFIIKNELPDFHSAVIRLRDKSL